MKEINLSYLCVPFRWSEKGMKFFMRIYCISDTPEVEVGLKLAGCDGTCLEESNEIENKIDEIAQNQDFGVFVITKKIYEKSKEKVDFIKSNKSLPLIAII